MVSTSRYHDDNGESTSSQANTLQNHNDLIPGTINSDGVFVAYMDSALAEVASMVSSSAVKTSDSSNNTNMVTNTDNATTAAGASQSSSTDKKAKIKEVRSEIKQQRAEIQQLRADRTEAREQVKLQREIVNATSAEYKDAKKQYKQQNITEQQLDVKKQERDLARVTLDQAKQNLSDIKTDLDNAKSKIKISKNIRDILKEVVSTDDLDPRIAKVISVYTNGNGSSNTLNPKIPVYIQTFANHTSSGTSLAMASEQIGLDSFVTKNLGDTTEGMGGDSYTAILDKPQIYKLASSEYVKSISLPHLVHTNDVPIVSGVTIPIGQGVNASFADRLHRLNVTGTNITVAVIDDSFVLSDPKLSSSHVSHTALYDSIGYCGNSLSCGKTQENSHGTATAGIIAEMAPDANLHLYTITTSADFENVMADIISRRRGRHHICVIGIPNVGW